MQVCITPREADASSSHKTPAKKQVTLAAAVSTVIPYDMKGPRWQAITDELTYHSAEEIVPIYTAEKWGSLRSFSANDELYILVFLVCLEKKQKCPTHNFLNIMQYLDDPGHKAGGQAGRQEVYKLSIK